MAQVSNPRKEFNFTIQIAPAPINPFLAQKVEIPEITIDQTEHGDTNHDIKTAGRIKFGKDIEDSVEIKRLFKLLESHDEYYKY